MAPGARRRKPVSGALQPPLLAKVAVPAPLPEPLTYRVPEALAGRVAPGVRVRVPLGRRQVVGVVMGAAESAPEGVRLREILEALDEADRPALPADLLATGEYAAGYYLAPPGAVVRAALPAAVGPGRGEPLQRKLLVPAREVVADPEAALEGLGRTPARRKLLAEALAGPPRTAAELARAAGVGPAAATALLRAGVLTAQVESVPVSAPPPVDFPVKPPPHLSEAQARAVEAFCGWLEPRRYQAGVLYGVTGSGKTEVYLRVAEHCLELGRSVLFLVPEIALAPGLSRALAGRFGERLAVLHSGLSDRQRHEAWQRCRQGRTRIVVGARSALFAPLERPGLIVVDEEHDGGYKQEESPRYHARDLALVRGREAEAVVLLGSATPSLEAWVLCERGKAELHRLPERVGGASLAEVEIVDMRKEFARVGEDRPLSGRLAEALEATLARGEQAMILLNRRGYTRVLHCRACGEGVGCPACSISLTWHQVGARLRCHYCGYNAPRPEACPTCSSPHLADVGYGTQRAEEAVREAVPEARVDRLDRDVARSPRRLAELLGRFGRGEIDVLVGTQMIAKGHDFHRVTLVGVLSADMTLEMPDFRAGERTFQLLTQVAGRSGRGERPGKVVVQAFRPNHPVLAAAARQDYDGFVKREWHARRTQHYPPDSALANLIVRDEDRIKALERAGALAGHLREAGEGKVAVVGPSIAPLARLRGLWRVQILARARKRSRLAAALARAVAPLRRGDGALPRWLMLDVDPQQLL